MVHRATKSGPDIPESAYERFADLYERQKNVARGMLELGKKLDIRVIATNDVHFIDAADDDSHDVLLALGEGKKLSYESRSIGTGEEYLKTADEMSALFAENPELISNTLEVADMIEEYKLDSPPIMPKFAIPAEFGTEEEYAKKFDEEALKREFNTPERPANFDRLGGYDAVLRIKLESDYLEKLVDGAKKCWGDPIPEYKAERIKFELHTIKTMVFPGYFLIVWDYVRAARRMGVWVGPGRGSAAGSAVAYALGITNVDPIQYDLLFERFLNPDRISMPDIDVDFDDAGRRKVLEYVARKYGSDHVAHIVTFGQMGAKSTIKDVGRVMDYPLAETNKLAKLVPDTPKITFKKARKEIPALEAEFNSESPAVHKLMERAGRLEGCVRQPGIHACGIVISREKLADIVPVMHVSYRPVDGLCVTQYDGWPLHRAGRTSQVGFSRSRNVFSNEGMRDAACGTGCELESGQDS